MKAKFIYSEMFKMKAKIENLPFEKFFRKTAINGTRGHSEKVYKPEARKRALANFFSARAVDTWNSLFKLHCLWKLH